ncbi:diaminopimelate epimerase [Kordiimonas sp. SCSIO 12610]|uniref:diaminopimelate epimerase n=1 Tax=Kordiimonas sp. SCSIO 12610 TaxID=2829597 RepID=UPI0021086B54|nr:diaminopimelate epimerase [Kordiimonas sp. SCSIO 12610]UTW55060.1 diaminopimelate epimerase [Kordiimonas sp. SCSIO 12610]
MSETQTYQFLKMHGLGNDFVIFDARENDLNLSDDQVRMIANRKRGVGFDQLILLRNSDQADVFMEIRNADGSRVEACGNATRCVGQIILDEKSLTSISIETDAGLLSAKTSALGISVNMGPANTEWQAIPLAAKMDTLQVDFTLGALSTPVCVNMGNPHAVFFVDDVNGIDLETLGPQIEHHPLFPERVNVSIASVNGQEIRQRVWERGVGITEACGTGACAGAVAAIRRNMIEGRKATVLLDGGPLEIEWMGDNSVQMTGSATLAFKGEIDL